MVVGCLVPVEPVGALEPGWNPDPAEIHGGRCGPREQPLGDVSLGDRVRGSSWARAKPRARTAGLRQPRAIPKMHRRGGGPPTRLCGCQVRSASRRSRSNPPIRCASLFHQRALRVPPFDLIGTRRAHLTLVPPTDKAGRKLHPVHHRGRGVDAVHLADFVSSGVEDEPSLCVSPAR
jgi:hypothetical protein